LFYKSWARAATPPPKTISALSDPFSKALPAEGLLVTVGDAPVLAVGAGAGVVMTGGRVAEGAGATVMGAGADTDADAGSVGSVSDSVGDGDGAPSVGDGEAVMGPTETTSVEDVCFFLAEAATARQATMRKVVVVNFMVFM